MDYTTCIMYLCFGVVLGALVIVIADLICRANEKAKKEEEKKPEIEEKPKDYFKDRLCAKIFTYNKMLEFFAYDYFISYFEKGRQIEAVLTAGRVDYFEAFSFDSVKEAMKVGYFDNILLTEKINNEWAGILFTRKNMKDRQCKWKNTCDYYRSR